MEYNYLRPDALKEELEIKVVKVIDTADERATNITEEICPQKYYG